MTVIYELARVHAAAGGETTVVLRRGAVDGYEPYGVGRVVEVELGDHPYGRAKHLDVLLGAAGAGRRAVRSAYAAAAGAVPRDLEGMVIVHNAPGAIPSLAAALDDVPVCLYAHNTLFRTYSRREARGVVDAAHRILCVSDFLADDLRQKLGRDDERIRTVRNGVDGDTFSPAERRADRLPVVLFVGRVIPDKGADLLARAAVELAARGAEFRLRIIGSSGFSADDPVSQYEREVRKLTAPLGDRVEYLPFQERSRVPSLYRDADIFCMPSNCDEAMGLSLLEALASGVACVVARRGGIPEAAGDAALYFQPPDHTELAAAIDQLLANPDECRRRGKLARQRGEELRWASSYAELEAALSD